MKPITEIKHKLQELKRIDSAFEIFGASAHQYQFNARLSEKEIKQFEEKYGVELPQDYKTFLTELSNDGAGPYYGIHPLQSDLGKFNPENKFELLRYNFPHKTAWNWSAPIFDKFDELRESEKEQVADFFDELYWESYCKYELTQGCIYIAEYGCALRFLLVVSGAEKGNIWFDQRADRKGITPVLDEQGNRLDFSDWYLTWLDKSLREIKTKKK